MFSQTKEEEQLQINYLISNPLYRKFFCPQHGFVYQYHCIYSDCFGFICGKIQCIDQHFHGTKLNIEKFNVAPFIEKIRRFENISHMYQTLTPTLNSLQSSVEQLKLMSANLFKLYKELKKNADIIVSNSQQPLNLSYLERMQELQATKQQIQIEIRTVSQIINWKNIWMNLQDQLQIIQQLKISFPVLKPLYFQHYPISEEHILIKQSKWMQEQVCQGIIVVYFTNDHYVIGKYMSSNNIQTCRLFIRNFTFIVNYNGEIHQENTLKETIFIHKEENSQYFLKINACQEGRMGRQLIKKVVCFKAFIEEP